MEGGGVKYGGTVIGRIVVTESMGTSRTPSPPTLCSFRKIGEGRGSKTHRGRPGSGEKDEERVGTRRKEVHKCLGGTVAEEGGDGRERRKHKTRGDPEVFRS